MGRRIAWALLAFPFLLNPPQLEAQVAWDSPPMISPGAPSGLSVLLWDADRGNDLGVMALWRSSAVPTGVGIRGGLAEQRGGDLAGMFGLDISGSLGSLGGSGSGAVVWWAGGGLGFGDEVLISFPVGITLGWHLNEDDLTFSPYFGGHVALDILTGPDDDLDLEGGVDLGMDLTFQSGFAIRFGATVGGREALAVGIRIPS